MLAEDGLSCSKTDEEGNLSYVVSDENTIDWKPTITCDGGNPIFVEKPESQISA